jgi:hypothetical protein
MLGQIEKFNAQIFSKARSICVPGSGLAVKPGFEEYYSATYQLWYQSISEGLTSEGLTEQAQALLSDDFLRQNEIHCLFNEALAIGLFAFSWMNLQFVATRKQQYFIKNYPPYLLDQICEQGHHVIMTMGHLSVHPDWRKSKIGFGVVDILMGFAVKRFLESPATLLLTFTRNNRKTHELCYRFGGKPLLKDQVSHTIASDIIAFHKDDVVPSPIEGIHEAVEKLWLKKTNISVIPLF